MELLLKAVLLTSGYAFLASWTAIIVASVMLRFCFDEEKMKWDATGARYWAIARFQKMPDVFTPAGVQLWKVRHAFLKIMTGAVAVMIVVALVAAIVDVSLSFA